MHGDEDAYRGYINAMHGTHAEVCEVCGEISRRLRELEGLIHSDHGDFRHRQDVVKLVPYSKGER